MPISANIQSIYTDGACTGNPGPGGWAAVVYFTDGSLHEIGGSAAQTTNNRMEMQAAIAALQLIAESSHPSAVTIHTDSEYLINGVTKWVKGWKKKRLENCPRQTRPQPRPVGNARSTQSSIYRVATRARSCWYHRQRAL